MVVCRPVVRPALRRILLARPTRLTRALGIEGCLYCVACGNYTYQPGYGCTGCGYVDPGL